MARRQNMSGMLCVVTQIQYTLIMCPTLDVKMRAETKASVLFLVRRKTK
jgi:hypothetical protein